MEYDPVHAQILSPLCRNCPDASFRNRHHRMFNVGCCSYSPVFTLFEIDRMIRNGDRDFLMERIYRPAYSAVRDYEIIVHAWVHPQYERFQPKPDDPLEADDLRQDFSVCRFFVEGKGCALSPFYKTSVCRAFVCTTVEERLSPEESKFLGEKVRSIYREASRFHETHKAVLQKKGWNLKKHPEQIFDYLENRPQTGQ